jgi:hypothetical protein
MKVHPISPIDRARLRAESFCAEDTIKAYPYVSDASKRRIEAAAEKLKIALPQTEAAKAP